MYALKMFLGVLAGRLSGQGKYLTSPCGFIGIIGFLLSAVYDLTGEKEGDKILFGIKKQ